VAFSLLHSVFWSSATSRNVRTFVTVTMTSRHSPTSWKMKYEGNYTTTNTGQTMKKPALLVLVPTRPAKRLNRVT